VSYLLQQLLDKTARRVPDRIAVVCKDRQVTYGELNQQSGKLAAEMLKQGLRPGDRVGIFHTKSIESIVAMMASLKAGGVYVPIDPLSPAKRVAYIIGNCQIGHLITSSDKLDNLLPELEDDGSVYFYLSDNAATERMGTSINFTDWRQIICNETEEPDVPRIETDLAYILYTSGSTGVPKGVMISHRAALTFVDWAHKEFQITQEDVISNHAPLHFDLSVFDIYVTFKSGARLVLVPQEYSTFPVMLTRLILEQQITIWYSVPSALILLITKGAFAKHSYPHLRLILFAGEVFPIKYLKKLRDLVVARLCNLYGPTETNVCTFYDASKLDDKVNKPVPIGKAIANYDVFILLENNSRAGPGEEGELCARGPGIMSGYWGDGDKTNRLLVDNPLQTQCQEKIYRTGDLVFEDENRNYHYVSRIDNMVKSRGYRIELGEIESVLYSHPCIHDAAVVAIPDEEVTSRIKAFIVSNSPDLSQDEILKYCHERIPAYMVPEFLEFRDSLPHTSTGKIDRNQLS
jgi:L-proline---[L-prolyl-carrier protein] ligase